MRREEGINREFLKSGRLQAMSLVKCFSSERVLHTRTTKQNPGKQASLSVEQLRCCGAHTSCSGRRKMLFTDALSPGGDNAKMSLGGREFPMSNYNGIWEVDS